MSGFRKNITTFLKSITSAISNNFTMPWFSILLALLVLNFNLGLTIYDRFFMSSEYQSWIFLSRFSWNTMAFPNWQYFTGILAAHSYIPALVLDQKWFEWVIIMAIICLYGAVIEKRFKTWLMPIFILTTVFFGAIIANILSVVLNINLILDFTYLFFAYSGFVATFYFFNLKERVVRNSPVMFLTIVSIIVLIPLVILFKDYSAALVYFLIGVLFYFFAIYVFGLFIRSEEKV